jgi:DNA-binding NarL/FixJ family response regulator
MFGALDTGQQGATDWSKIWGILLKANCRDISPEWEHKMKKKLFGKTIHVVGPRRMENELLVNFIRTETSVECVVTDFDEIERHIADTPHEPYRLFLIDYREPRLREILKQASLNGNGSPLSRRLIGIYNSGKNKDAKDGKRPESTCGILYGCDSVAALINRICSLFSDKDTLENGSAEHAEVIGEITTSSCPLTWRELQLLMLMTEGLRNREIAGRIGISSHTVRTHLYNSFRKIDARNRIEAAAWLESHISMLYLLI